MALLALLTFNVLNSIALLLLLSIGLGVIYGMMKVINLAHGEFVMLGAYTTVVCADAGVNIWLCMLVLAPLVCGVIGLIVERGLIRFLYGRMIDTMLATWGLSLALIGLVTTIFGNNVRGVSNPLGGGFSIGPYQTSLYGVLVILLAISVCVLLWVALRYSRFGLIVRATMQNPDMSAALGVSPPLVYMATFAIGSALAGLAGGILAPISGVSPGMGAAFIAKAFITVLGGGPAIITGTSLASGLFGTISELATFQTTPVFGQVALLIAAIVMIRLLPQGITGRFLRRSV